MVKTIGNPLTWVTQGVAGTGKAVADATTALGSPVTEVPQTHHITMVEIGAALRKGLHDFTRFRSDVMFLGLIYPIIGIALAVTAFHGALLPMIFPLAAGFLLIGPVAAIGLYEMSRQSERRNDVGWGAALSVIRARNIGPVLVMTLYLMALFIVWLAAAFQIHALTLGDMPGSAMAFLTAVLTTPAGWAMIVIGLGVGFVFAAIALVTSFLTLPMLIDRHAGLPVAVATSLRVARESPAAVAAWGLIVAALMLVGSLPFFLGLIVVFPVLGHATWHLYRAAVPV